MFDSEKLITKENGREAQAVIGDKYHYTDNYDDIDDVEHMVNAEDEEDTGVLQSIRRDADGLVFIMEDGEEWDAIYPYEKREIDPMFDPDKIISLENASVAVLGRSYYYSDHKSDLERYVKIGGTMNLGELTNISHENGSYPFTMNETCGWRYLYPFTEVKVNPLFDPDKILSAGTARQAIVGKKYYHSDHKEMLRDYVTQRNFVHSNILMHVELGSEFPFTCGADWKYLYPVETKAYPVNEESILDAGKIGQACIGQKYFYSDSKTNVMEYALKQDESMCGTLKNIRSKSADTVYDIGNSVWRYIYPAMSSGFDIDLVIGADDQDRAVVGKRYHFADSKDVNITDDNNIGVLVQKDGSDSIPFEKKDDLYYDYLYPVKGEDYTVTPENADMQKPYFKRVLEFIAENELQEGDIVQVKGKGTGIEDGWGDSWNSRTMDSTIGKRGQILLRLNPMSYNYGLRVSIPDGGIFNYPFSVLELIGHKNDFYTSSDKDEFKKTELGKKFIEKHLESVIPTFLKRFPIKASGFYNEISGAFAWNTTPEGYEYWYAINGILKA